MEEALMAGQLEDLGPDFEALPDDDLGADFEALPSLEEEKAADEKKLSLTYSKGLRTDVEKNADLHALARKAETPKDVVAARADEFHRRVLEDHFSPKEWREQNPEAAKIALADPAIGEVVMRDARVSQFSKAMKLIGPALRGTGLLGGAPEALKGIYENFGAAYSGEPPKVDPEPAPTQQAFISNEKTKALESLDAVSQAIIPVLGRFKEAQAGFEVNKLYSRLARERAAGYNSADTLAAIDEAEKRALPLDFNEGPVQSLFVDVAQAVASQVETYGDAGKVAGVTAAVGAGVGLAASKSPAVARVAGAVGLEAGGAVAGALELGSLGGKIGLAASTFNLEFGSTYGSLLRAKTEAGEPISNELATGASLIAAAFKTAIEIASEKEKFKAMGPLGAALLSGEKAAAQRELVRNLANPAFRAIALRAAKAWGASSLTEAFEEVFQDGIDDAVKYFTLSATQGQFQKTSDFNFEKSAVTLEKTFFGNLLGPGAVTGGVNLVTHAVARQNLLDDGKKVAAIAGLTDSPSARAAPEAVASMIADATAKTGEPVTHLYVDPVAFTKLFQSENNAPEGGATSLLGPEGPRLLQEAVATGSKIEVPLAAYLERWGGTELAAKLVDDTTTSPAYLTANEQKKHAKEIDAQTQALVDAVEGAEPAATEDSKFFDDLESQLAIAGQSKRDARASLAPLKALYRTMAQRFGVEKAADLFSDKKLSIAPGDNASETPAGALAQNSFSQANLRDEFSQLEPEEQHGKVFRDGNTQLFNEAGFQALPQPADRPYLAEFEVEGAKHLNDAHGHASVDGALRGMAAVLKKSVPDGAKVGGALKAWVKSPAKANSIAADMQKALGGRLRVTSGAAQSEANLGETAKAAKAAHIAVKDKERAAGRLGKRGAAPVSVAADATVENPLVAQLKAAEPGGAVNLTPAHQAAFEQLGDKAFDAAFRETSGLLNEEGFRAVRRLNPERFVLSADMRGLGPMNEAFGTRGADQILRTFSELVAMYASDFDPSHPHGDEFNDQAGNAEQLIGAYEDLRNATNKLVFFKTRPDGSVAIQEGLHFVYGIGDSEQHSDPLDHADRVALPEAKAKQGAVPGPRIVTQEVADRELESARSRGERIVRLEEGDDRGSGKGEGGAPGQEVSRVNQPADGDASTATPRGYTEFAREGLQRIFRVALNKNADLSTFLHESGHVFLEFFGDLSERSDVPAQVKADWETTLRYLGVGARGDLKTEHHEKFARAFEAYLREGKAPSSRLEAVFTRFKLWLTDIYRTVSQLNVALNDEVRGVFDRLLATAAELERAKARQGLSSPLFRSPEEAGMTPEQWQAYQAEQLAATSHATRAAEHRALKEKLRETETWWKEAEAKEREQAAEDYEALPARKAQQLLRGKGEFWGAKTTAIALNRKAVEEAIGDGVSSFLTSKEGLHPDEVAELAGFPTGRQMLHAVVALPQKSDWVKQTAAERMLEKHPGVVDDRTKLRELVAKGLHGDFTAKWLLREWAALRRLAGAAGAPPVEAIKRAAEQLVQRRAVGRLDAGQALQAERSAANKAAMAAAKGEFSQAYIFKQQQLLNMYLWRELTEAREQREAFEELADSLSKDKARAKLGKASPVYRGAVDLVLESFELKEPEAREELLPSLGEVVAQMTADGATVAFDEAALGRLLAQPRNWKTLSVAEMEQVGDALKNVKSAATAKNTVLLDGRRVEKELVVADLVADAAKNLPSLGALASSESAKSGLEKLGGLASAIDGELLKPETMLHWLGGRDRKSPWVRAILEPLQAAKQRESDLLKGAVKPIVDAFNKMPAEMRRRFTEKVDGKALFPNHRADVAPPTRRFELLMMALNMGSQSNADRLTEGRGITEAEVLKALEVLTEAEADWVQSVWDANEGLGALAFDLEERDTGLRPEKVKARTLKLPVGALKGGYFPAVYDGRVEAVGERQEAAIAGMLDPSFTRPGTARGHLKRRVEGFSGALSLEPGRIGTHLSQVAHDVAFREAIKSVGSLVLDPTIQAALTERLGIERGRQFRQWLTDVGQMRGAQQATAGQGLLKVIRGLRANTIISVLGYSATTALGDLSNIPAAVVASDLKAKHWAAGLAEFAGAPIQTVKLAEAKSGELRYRRDSLQRELTQQIKKLTATGPLSKGPLAWLKEHAFAFLEFSDRATSTPVWLGRYRQALADGLTDDEAVKTADAVIRKLFPSHSPVDASAVLRDKGFLGTSLLFYGYFNTTYNVYRDMFHDLHTADDKLESAKRLPSIAGRALAFAVATSAVGEFLAGRGREPEEEWEQWFLRKVLAGGLSAAPFGGDVAQLIEAKVLNKRQVNAKAGPLVNFAEQLWKAFEAVVDDEKELSKRVADIARLAGTVLGLPTSQPLRTGTFLGNLSEGGAVARNPADVAGGLIYGQRENQPANPASVVGDAISGER